MLVIKKIPVSIQYIMYYMPLIFFNSRDRSILVAKCKTKLDKMKKKIGAKPMHTGDVKQRINFGQRMLY